MITARVISALEHWRRSIRNINLGGVASNRIETDLNNTKSLHGLILTGQIVSIRCTYNCDQFTNTLVFWYFNWSSWTDSKHGTMIIFILIFDFNFYYTILDKTTIPVMIKFISVVEHFFGLPWSQADIATGIKFCFSLSSCFFKTRKPETYWKYSSPRISFTSGSSDVRSRSWIAK